jgi:hypothetical protein
MEIMRSISGIKVSSFIWSIHNIVSGIGHQCVLKYIWHDTSLFSLTILKFQMSIDHHYKFST